MVTVRLKGAKKTLKLSQKQLWQVVNRIEMLPCLIWVFPKIVGFPKSSILIGYSIINHPFWGTSIFWKYPYLVEANACIIFGSTF